MTVPPGPICTRDSLAEDLRKLGIVPGETLLLHSSLSSLGWVVGGAVTVVESILDALGTSGTLAVPTMTVDNSDPASWSNPPVPREWWPVIRAATPAYDPRVTPSTWMGAIAETVRTWPDARRSDHPQTSFAAVGPRAASITDGHSVDCRLGEKSPLARLEAAGARVLLLGAGFDACTCFHLAEYRVAGPFEEISFAVRSAAGREWTTVRERRIDSDDFAEIGRSFTEDRNGRISRGPIGGASCTLFGLADAVGYAEHWMRRNR